MLELEDSLANSLLRAAHGRMVSVNRIVKRRAPSGITLYSKIGKYAQDQQRIDTCGH